MARKHTSNNEIAVIGDGLAGLVMALSLGVHDIPCVLIGPGSPASDDSRTTAIMQDGIDFVETLGVWDEKFLQAVPLRTMRLIAQDNSIAFPSTEIGLPQFGFNIANSALKKALLQAITRNKNITYHKTTVAALAMADNGMPAQIMCADGTGLAARLVIAADGHNSFVRDQAGIAVTQTDANQAALVCVVTTDVPHDFTSTEWYHSGGPFTLVPMQGQQMGVVYCDTPEIIADMATWDREALSTYFTDFSNGLYGNLHVTNDVQIWPVAPQQATQLVANRAALIGEAAHAMPPLAAQGFNTSLRDIQALQTVVSGAFALGLDIGHLSVLKTYADTRRLDTRLRGIGVNALNRVIRRDDWLGQKLHAWGFQTMTHLQPLKKLLMRAALAPRKPGRAA